MSEPFLEEQIRRIRDMSEQMSRLRDRAAELAEERERDRIAGRQGMLRDITDLRSHTTNGFAPDHADDRPSRHASRPASRSRRK